MRYCVDHRCRMRKRTPVYPSMAAALKRLSSIAGKVGTAEAKQHRVEQCLECNLWRLRRDGLGTP